MKYNTSEAQSYVKIYYEKTNDKSLKVILSQPKDDIITMKLFIYYKLSDCLFVCGFVCDRTPPKRRLQS